MQKTAAWCRFHQLGDGRRLGRSAQAHFLLMENTAVTNGVRSPYQKSRLHILDPWNQNQQTVQTTRFHPCNSCWHFSISWILSESMPHPAARVGGTNLATRCKAVIRTSGRGRRYQTAGSNGEKRSVFFVGMSRRHRESCKRRKKKR